MITDEELRAFSQGFTAAVVEEEQGTPANNPYLVPGPFRRAWSLGATAYRSQSGYDDSDDREDCNCDEEPDFDDRHDGDEDDGED